MKSSIHFKFLIFGFTYLVLSSSVGRADFAKECVRANGTITGKVHAPRCYCETTFENFDPKTEKCPGKEVSPTRQPSQPQCQTANHLISTVTQAAKNAAEVVECGICYDKIQGKDKVLDHAKCATKFCQKCTKTLFNGSETQRCPTCRDTIKPKFKTLASDEAAKKQTPDALAKENLKTEKAKEKELAKKIEEEAIAKRERLKRIEVVQVNGKSKSADQEIIQTIGLLTGSQQRQEEVEKLQNAKLDEIISDTGFFSSTNRRYITYEGWYHLLTPELKIKGLNLLYPNEINYTKFSDELSYSPRLREAGEHWLKMVESRKNK